MPGAKTLTLDSKTGKVLLIAAEYGAATTPPAGGGRGGRGAMAPVRSRSWWSKIVGIRRYDREGTGEPRLDSLCIRALNLLNRP